MKDRIIILSLLTLSGLLFSACQTIDIFPREKACVELVELSAVMNDRPETRTPIEGISYPFSVAVWASTTSCSYPNVGKDGTSGVSYQVDKHLTATFNQSSTTLNGPDNSGVRYPYNEGGDPVFANVYFVGLYPSLGWSTASGTNAAFTFDGSKDAMYAPQVSGNGDPATSAPTLTFYHLLTYLRFNIIAESDAAQNAWGRLTSIKLTKQNNGASNPMNNLSISLDSPVPANIGAIEAKSTFTSSVSQLSLYANGTNTVFPASAYTIPTSAATPAAYVICAPVTASDASGTNEYTLTINTEKRAPVIVGVNLKSGLSTYYSGSTMGKEFTVNLTFTLNHIAASATVNGWTTGGIGKEDVSE
ncbi:MAG: fimbrillin family protein [Bacteroidales bacterium]|nr:fimbrillin family protein [Bacteroidales bacterium]